MFISFSSLSMSIRPLRLNNGYPEKPQSWSMYLFFHAIFLANSAFNQVQVHTSYSLSHDPQYLTKVSLDSLSSPNIATIPGIIDVGHCEAMWCVTMSWS